MDDDLKLKLRSLLRRAGLADTPKHVLACLCIVAVLLIGFALWRFWPAGPATAGQDFALEAQVDDGGNVDTQSVDDGQEIKVICVDVEGAVRNPGLYELPQGSRVGDAVAAAGGLGKRAAKGQVNLASALEDGQQVVVPRKGEGASARQGEASGSSVSSSAASRAGTVGQDGSSSGKVNINTATAEQLQQLSGIGEALSQRIVDYRQSNGSFASVDELSKVSGIGSARLAAIRDSICV